MRIIISLVFLLASGLLTFLFTAKQVNCAKPDCSFDGITVLKQDRVSYIEGLKNAQDLEKRRKELEDKYNSVTDDERNRLEALVPNNVDNIKLIIELETIAKRYGILIEDPKLEADTNAPLNSSAGAGQNLRGNSAVAAVSSGTSNNLYGFFSIDFTVRTNYTQMKQLLGDIEKNLRLMEPTDITVKVPPPDRSNNNKKTMPDVYDITMKSNIYYLNN